MTRRQKADAVTSRLNITAVVGRSGARLMRVIVIPQREPGGELYLRPGTCALLSDSLHNICPTGQNLGGGRITLASLPLRILGGRVPPPVFTPMMTGAPSYLILSQHLVQHVATRQTRSTALPLLTIPRTNTEFARHSYSYSAPFIWNSLPGDVLNCNSEHTFKKHLKTFLFNSCFYGA